MEGPVEVRRGGKSEGVGAVKGWMVEGMGALGGKAPGRMVWEGGGKAAGGLRTLGR